MELTQSDGGVGKQVLADEEGALKVPICLKREKNECKWAHTGEKGLCEQTQPSIRQQRRQACGF